MQGTGHGGMTGRGTGRATWAIAAACTLATAGCRSFEKDWTAARSGSLAVDARGLSGVHGERSRSFSTRLKGTWTNDVFVFSGTKRVFGVPIRTAGRVDPRRLESGYDSPLDRGTFTLGRPAAD